jgi:hypothetical protein
MIRDVQRWRAFEAAWVASRKTDYAENLRLVEGMYQLARTLGRFTADDALDGIDKDIRLASLLHRVRGTP